MLMHLRSPLAANGSKCLFPSLLKFTGSPASRIKPISLLSTTQHLTSSKSDLDVQKIALEEKQKYWMKNKDLKRPVSPHLTVYNWQVTNTLSIIHRITGVSLYAGLLLVAVPYIMNPYMFPAYVGYISSLNLGVILLTAAKFCISWPVVYHTLNGVRHLFWDVGYGFDLNNLTMSGYAVAATSVALALMLAIMKA